MESLNIYEGLIWTTSAALLITIVMFNEKIKGGVDMASARVKSLYNRATSLGLSSFNEEELNDTEKSRKIKNFRNAHVGGLYNEGNTCFMNSVIQAFASCDSIADFVDTFRNDLNFSGGLGDVIRDLNQIHTRQHGYSTVRLVRLLGGGTQRWSRYNQEDAQEFFQELLNTLENDMKEKQKESLSTTGEEEGKGKDPNKKESKRITPFDGKFAVRVGCLNCGDMEGIRTGIISSVDLSLDLEMSKACLDDLLRNYTAMEQISGVECYRCSLNEYRIDLQKKLEESNSCKNEVLMNAFQKRVKEVDEVLLKKVIDDSVYKRLKCPSYRVQSDKTKQTMFSRPNPDVLMIHINRSVFDLRTGIARKNFASVDFPVVLDLTQFTVDPTDPTNNDPRCSMHGLETEEKDLYDLKAAVVHYGSAYFGHYISFRKFHGFWWRISDDQVDLTTEAQVLNAQGVFMLFYERRGASNRPEFPTSNPDLLDQDSDDSQQRRLSSNDSEASPQNSAEHADESIS